MIFRTKSLDGNVDNKIGWAELTCTFDVVVWSTNIAWDSEMRTVLVLGPKKITENVDRVSRSQDLRDVYWLLASSLSFNCTDTEFSLCLFMFALKFLHIFLQYMCEVTKKKNIYIYIRTVGGRGWTFMHNLNWNETCVKEVLGSSLVRTTTHIYFFHDILQFLHLDPASLRILSDSAFINCPSIGCYRRCKSCIWTQAESMRNVISTCSRKRAESVRNAMSTCSRKHAESVRNAMSTCSQEHSESRRNVMSTCSQEHSESRRNVISTFSREHAESRKYVMSTCASRVVLSSIDLV
jgi:hypothetical protein